MACSRYAVIVTEHTGDTDAPNNPIHWLLKGTVVEVLVDEKGQEYVQCVAPCFGVSLAQFPSRRHIQYLNPEDIIELAPDQLDALRAASSEA